MSGKVKSSKDDNTFRDGRKGDPFHKCCGKTTGRRKTNIINKYVICKKFTTVKKFHIRKKFVTGMWG